MKETVRYILAKIVDNPDDVVVDEASVNGRVVLKVSASPKDYGKIIGKKGKNIDALRTLMKAIGAKNEKGCSVELDEGNDYTDVK
jgi:predicted RNA-binding protein YlqC (UPF0109 family)